MPPKRWHPDRKTGWSSLTGAATVVVIWISETIFGVQMGAEVASALVTCIVAAVSYLTEHESEVAARTRRDLDPEP